MVEQIYVFMQQHASYRMQALLKQDVKALRYFLLFVSEQSEGH